MYCVLVTILWWFKMARWWNELKLNLLQRFCVVEILWCEGCNEDHDQAGRKVRRTSSMSESYYDSLLQICPKGCCLLSSSMIDHFKIILLKKVAAALSFQQKRIYLLRWSIEVISMIILTITINSFDCWSHWVQRWFGDDYTCSNWVNSVCMSCSVTQCWTEKTVSCPPTISIYLE